MVDGCRHKLVIHDAHLKDAAEYTVNIGDESSSANLEVEGIGLPQFNLLCMLFWRNSFYAVHMVLYTEYIFSGGAGLCKRMVPRFCSV